MKEINFTVQGPPQSKARARHRVGKSKSGKVFSMTYKAKKTRDAEDSFIGQAVQHKPEVPIPGPVGLKIHFFMPIPKSTSKKNTAEMIAGHISHLKKPDLDNLIKLVKDALSGVFFLDDKQVVYLTADKSYSEVPRTEVEVAWEVEDGKATD